MRINRASFISLLALSLVIHTAASAQAAPGDLDFSFGGDGKVDTAQIGTDILEAAEDVAMQPDGKLVAVGTATSNSGDNWMFALVRYNTNGTVDQSFGHGGVTTDLGGFAFGRAVVIQPDGRIVAGGDSECRFVSCFTVVRYNTDGTLDRSFANTGVARSKFRKCGCEINDLALQADGKIVAAGWRYKGGDANDDDVVALLRYNADGTVDRSFGRFGRVSLSFGYGDDTAWGVAIQPDGKIVVAGQGTENMYATGLDFALARLNPDGSLDTSFSGDGMQTTNVSAERWDWANGVAIQPDGKLVTAGVSYSDFVASDPRFVVMRHNADGSVDATFGGDGILVTSVGSFGGYAEAAASYGGGRVLAAGRSFVDPAQDSSDFVVVRYASDGDLDPSWGGDGIVVTSFGSGADVSNALAVQPDGKIVAAGEVYTRFGLARYLGDAWEVKLRFHAANQPQRTSGACLCVWGRHRLRLR